MVLAMPLHHTVRRGWTAASTWGREAQRHCHAASNTSPIPADCCPDSPLELHLLAKSGPSQDGSLCSPSLWKEGGEGEYRTWSPGVGEGGSVGQAFRGAEGRQCWQLTTAQAASSVLTPLGPGGLPRLYLTGSQLPHQEDRAFSLQAARNSWLNPRA